MWNNQGVGIRIEVHERLMDGNALRPVESDNVLYFPKVMFVMYNPERPNWYRLPDTTRKQDNLYRKLKINAELYYHPLPRARALIWLHLIFIIW